MTAASLQTNHRREGAHRAGPRRAAFLTALAGVAALFAQSALAQSARLEKIELQPQAGNQLQVKLVLDGPAPQPVTFTIVAQVCVYFARFGVDCEPKMSKK